MAVILFVLGQQLQKLHFCSYDESGIQLEVNDNTIRCISDDGTPFSITSYDVNNDTSEMVYFVVGEYTYAGKLFYYDNQALNDTITIEENQVVTVYYYNAETNESILMYHNTDKISENDMVNTFTENGGITPVLALQYYLMFVLPAVVLIIICVLLIKMPFKNRPNLKSNTTYLLFVPVAYLIALVLTQGVLPMYPE